MKDQDQIKALAELDGLYPFELCGLWHWQSKDGKRTWLVGNGLSEEHLCAITPYRISYDAIIPLIQKQEQAVRLACHYKGDPIVIRGTPPQLCEALLRATGKWADK